MVRWLFPTQHSRGFRIVFTMVWQYFCSESNRLIRFDEEPASGSDVLMNRCCFNFLDLSNKLSTIAAPPSTDTQATAIILAPQETTRGTRQNTKARHNAPQKQSGTQADELPLRKLDWSPSRTLPNGSIGKMARGVVTFSPKEYELQGWPDGSLIFLESSNVRSTAIWWSSPSTASSLPDNAGAQTSPPKETTPGAQQQNEGWTAAETNWDNSTAVRDRWWSPHKIFSYFLPPHNNQPLGRE